MYHFSKVIGQKSLPTFKNLEEGFNDMGLVVLNNGLPKIDDGNCNYLPNLKMTGHKTKRGCQKLGMKVKLVWPNCKNT
jgi:hypothetical protein